MTSLEATYNGFVQCLNARKWKDLGIFLHSEFSKNGEFLTPEAFATRLKPVGDLYFDVKVLVVDEKNQTLASTLFVTWKPSEPVMGIEPRGKTVKFVEKHLTGFLQGKLAWMLDIPDREAIYRQLSDLEPVYKPDLDITTWANDEGLGPQPSPHNLEELYKDYIRCINERTTDVNLEKFVHPQAVRNGVSMTREAYSGIEVFIASAIPDLEVDIKEIIVDEKAQRLAARLESTGTPAKALFGIEPGNQKLRFNEYASYQFQDGKISHAWTLGSWGSYRNVVPEKKINNGLW